MKNFAKILTVTAAAAIVTGATVIGANSSAWSSPETTVLADIGSTGHRAIGETVPETDRYKPVRDRLDSLDPDDNGDLTSVNAEIRHNETAETVTETVVTESTAETTTETIVTEEIPEVVEATPVIHVENLGVETVSVSCLKITWDAEPGRQYDLSVETDADYQENITFVFKGDGLCYLTGLREDSEYTITVSPVIGEDEDAEPVFSTVTGRTQAVEVVYEFEYIDGWTGCFAGERASGLTAMPSSGAIYGSHKDDITDTTIRRFDNGDYCVAMGTHFGYCNDRFLIEMENGTQFTVRICDSKGGGDVQDEGGYGMWHWFGGVGAGKCIIEMIYDSDAGLPGCVSFSGSWGGYNWNGLDLGGNIKSIKMINY